MYYWVLFDCHLFVWFARDLEKKKKEVMNKARKKHQNKKEETNDRYK